MKRNAWWKQAPTGRVLLLTVCAALLLGVVRPALAAGLPAQVDATATRPATRTPTPGVASTDPGIAETQAVLSTTATVSALLTQAAQARLTATPGTPVPTAQSQATAAPSPTAVTRLPDTGAGPGLALGMLAVMGAALLAGILVMHRTRTHEHRSKKW